MTQLTEMMSPTEPNVIGMVDGVLVDHFRHFVRNNDYELPSEQGY